MADLRDDRTAAGCLTLLGLLFLLAGGGILMHALGVISLPGRFYVSRWALAIPGVAFLAPGAAMSLFGILRWVRPSLIASVMADLRGSTRTAALGLTLFGLCFFLAGAGIILQGLGVISMPGDLYVSRWVFAVSGVVFLAPGTGVLVAGIRGLFWPSTLGEQPPPSILGLIVSIVLTCLALTCVGAAFYGDPEGFYGGFTGSAIEGRIVFTIGGVVVGIIALVFWVLTLASIFSSQKRTKSGGA